MEGGWVRVLGARSRADGTATVVADAATVGESRHCRRRPLVLPCAGMSRSVGLSFVTCCVETPCLLHVFKCCQVALNTYHVE